MAKWEEKLHCSGVKEWVTGEEVRGENDCYSFKRLYLEMEKQVVLMHHYYLQYYFFRRRD